MSQVYLSSPFSYFRKKRLFVGVCLVLLGLTVSQKSAHASLDFFIGGGAQFSQLQLLNATASGDSYYRGLSYQPMLRFRITPVSHRGVFNFGVDILPIFRIGNFSNTASSSETAQLTQIGGGLEIYLGMFFFGLAYSGNTLEVRGSGDTTTLSYPSLMASGGIRIDLSKSFFLQLMGTLSYGIRNSANTSNVRAFYEFGGAASLHYYLFRFPEGSGLP